MNNWRITIYLTWTGTSTIPKLTAFLHEDKTESCWKFYSFWPRKLLFPPARPPASLFLLECARLVHVFIRSIIRWSMIRESAVFTFPFMMCRLANSVGPNIFLKILRTGVVPGLELSSIFSQTVRPEAISVCWSFGSLSLSELNDNLLLFCPLRLFIIFSFSLLLSEESYSSVVNRSSSLSMLSPVSEWFCSEYSSSTLFIFF